MTFSRSLKIALPLLAFVGALLALPDVALAAGGGEAPEAIGWWVFVSAFGIGFFTSLTPCVYPMIPIVIGVFGAKDENVSRKQAFMLATMYVLGMATLFTTLGVAFARAGGSAGTLLANPYVVIPIVGIYVALAASMFGFWEMQLPAALQNRLNQVGGKGYGGAYGMGLVGGLTAAPCVGPFMAGILLIVGKSGNIALGASVMFVYALGMGVLFWGLAVAAMSLPRSGKWMEWIKGIGGLGLLVVGFYFLRPVFPALAELSDPGFLFLAISLALGIGGIALGAIHLSFHGGAVEKLRKSAALIVAFVGFAGVVNWALTADRHLPWVTDEAAAFATAEESGKGVMLDFSAEWCIPCKNLEKNTFADGKVYDKILADYIPLKIDVTEDSDEDEAIKERYKVGAQLPAVLFLTKDKVELGRVTSDIGPSDFIEAMDKAAKQRTTTASAP